MTQDTYVYVVVSLPPYSAVQRVFWSRDDAELFAAENEYTFGIGHAILKKKLETLDVN